MILDKGSMSEDQNEGKEVEPALQILLCFEQQPGGLCEETTCFGGSQAKPMERRLESPFLYRCVSLNSPFLSSTISSRYVD